MEQPRPEVTVRDPRRPMLDVPEPEPAPSAGHRRRWLAVGVAALVAGASALVVADVVRDRRAAVEERRLDGVVDVALHGGIGDWSTSHDPGTGTGSLEARVRVVNHGPRPVVITGAELVGGRFDGELPLAARGGSAGLRVTRTVRCPRDGTLPPVEREAAVLVLELQAPSGRREVVLEGGGLPVGSVNEQVRRACGFPPLAETVLVSGAVVSAEGPTARVHLDVRNEGRRPVRLLSLVPSRGLTVLSIDGDPAALPLTLPAAPGGAATVRSLDLRLGLICQAFVATDPLRPFEELYVLVDDGGLEQIGQINTLLDDDQRRLRQFAVRGCGLG